MGDWLIGGHLNLGSFDLFLRVLDDKLKNENPDFHIY